MSGVDMDYYEHRAVGELERAVAAADPIAAEIHRRLAILYRTKAADLGIEPRLQIVPEIDPGYGPTRLR